MRIGPELISDLGVLFTLLLYSFFFFAVVVAVVLLQIMRKHFQIERMTGCPRNSFSYSYSNSYSYSSTSIPAFWPFIHYDIGQQKTCKSWKWPRVTHPCSSFPPLSTTNNKARQDICQDEKLIKQKFLIFAALSLSHSLLFYLFMLNHRKSERNGP